MKPLSLNEARERVGRAIFSDTWIGSLTDQEWGLRRQFLKARRVRQLEGATVTLVHAEPCPAAMAGRLDKALGRFARLDGQYASVDTWLSEHGFVPDPRAPIDRKSFNKAIATIAVVRGKEKAKRGPKPKEVPRILAAIRAEIAAGTLTDEALKSSPDKEMMERFAGKRERCRAAREKYFAEK